MFLNHCCWIDWIVILVDGILDKNIDKYTNNEKFFMWA